NRRLKPNLSVSMKAPELPCNSGLFQRNNKYWKRRQIRQTPFCALQIPLRRRRVPEHNSDGAEQSEVYWMKRIITTLAGISMTLGIAAAVFESAQTYKPPRTSEGL